MGFILGRFLKRAIPLLLGVCVAFAAGAFIAKNSDSLFSEWTVDQESTNSQVIKSVTREEQISLLALGIQGIKEQRASSKLFGVHVPGSEKNSFLQYSFDAKLGIDGKEVKIKQVGEDHFLVTIPNFIFIGHNNSNFKLVAENNGALSWVTPENDPVEMINSILTDDLKNEYIAQNEDVLKQQVESFYKGIINGVDPMIQVEFSFEEGQVKN